MVLFIDASVMMDLKWLVIQAFTAYHVLVCQLQTNCATTKSECYKTSDVDECVLPRDLCGHHGTCINLPNGRFYYCKCDDGYKQTGDPKTRHRTCTGMPRMWLAIPWYTCTAAYAIHLCVVCPLHVIYLDHFWLLQRRMMTMMMTIVKSQENQLRKERGDKDCWTSPSF